MITIIGAGGVGSYLIPCLSKTTKRITIWDGDCFEEKNLKRQLFDSKEVGNNKAKVLAAQYGVKGVDDYFYKESDLDICKVIMCCVDNDKTRMDIFDYADENNCIVIVGANETFSSEAYVYLPAWKGGPRDPRVIYPELAEGRGRDPRAPACNDDDAIAENPQLPMSNMTAAALMMRLYEYYTNKFDELSEDDQIYAPHTHYASRVKMSTKLIGDRDGSK